MMQQTCLMMAAKFGAQLGEIAHKTPEKLQGVVEGMLIGQEVVNSLQKHGKSTDDTLHADLLRAVTQVAVELRNQYIEVSLVLPPDPVSSP